MDFTIDRNDLAQAVVWAARGVPVRPPSPAVAGLLVEVRGSTARFVGFDYETSCEASVDADVLGQTDEWSGLVPGQLFASVVKGLPGEPVRFIATIDGSRLNLTCGRTEFSIPTMAVEDYPSLPEMPQQSGTMEGDILRDVIESVAVAADRGGGPSLAGVRIEVEGDRLAFVATDLYRLAMREVTWTPEDGSMTMVVLVPAATLLGIAKGIPSGTKVGVAISRPDSGEGMMGFSFEGFRTTTRLLEAQFPAYRKILPSTFVARAEIATTLLQDAIKRVALVSGKAKAVRLAFSEGEVSVSAGGGDEANAAESILCEYSSDPLTIAFNPTYLLDGLSHIGGMTYLNLTAPNRPVLLTGVGEGIPGVTDTYRYLVMPIKSA